MHTKHIEPMRTALYPVAFVLVWSVVAGAQVDVRRKLPVVSDAKPVERTARGNTTDMVAYVQDVEVSINLSAFNMTFYTVPNVVPTIEIGSVAPRHKNDRWSFPHGESRQGNAFASQGTGPLSRKVGTIANTLYTFESTMFNIADLEPGTKYYYIISIPGANGASQHQTTGNFTTPDRNVTVVFEAVKIISDGDPDAPRPLPPDCGEISLWFWANYQQPNAKFISIPKLGRGDIGACTDHLYDLKRELSLWNAPNILALSVSGRDDDRGDYAGTDVLGAFEPAPVEKPRDTGDEELNGASGEFNLTKIGAGEIKRFTLVSKAAGGGGQGDLMFEVYGYIKISYPQP